MAYGEVGPYQLLTLFAFRCDHGSICLSDMAPTLPFHAELKAPVSAPAANVLMASCELWSSQRGRLAASIGQIIPSIVLLSTFFPVTLRWV